MEKQINLQQEQDLLGNQRKKWNWKKITLLMGATTFFVSSTSLISWKVSEHFIKTSATNKTDMSYTKINTAQFNDLHTRFYNINNSYIKKLATEQLLFYLPSQTFEQLNQFIIWPQNNTSYNLTPNLEKILKEKLLNTVGSHLRVWGLNTGYTFDTNLAILSSWNFNEENNKIKFDLNLGYYGTNETFKLKGIFKNSEDITTPVKDLTEDNLAIIFKQANEIFNSEINRDGYFIGVDFKGSKNEDLTWLGSQTIDLQEFNQQVWDYTLNSLKNFNLVQENVFVNGLKLFKIDGWNPDKLYVKAKEKIKVNENKNQIWLPEESDFGVHSIVSKVTISYRANEKINFEFTGSYLQNNQWGNY